MKTQESSFVAHDGIKIHTGTWFPDGDYKAVVILVHGYAEHTGRYTRVIKALVEAGYRVYGADLRGHGQSGGARGVFTKHEDPLEDMRRFYAIVRQAQPKDKIFFLGHSTGGLISIAFAFEKQAELAGLITTGAAVSLAERATPMLRTIANVVYRLSPVIPIQPAGSIEELHSDPEILQEHRADPYQYNGALKVGMGKFLVDKGEEVTANLYKLTLPLLTMQGSLDPVVPPSAAPNIHQYASSQDKTLKMWEGLKHEILNEPQRQEIFTMIIDWLNKH